VTVSQNRNGQADYQLRRVPDRKRVDTQGRVEQAGVLGGTAALAGSAYALSRPKTIKDNPDSIAAWNTQKLRQAEYLDAKKQFEAFVPKPNDKKSGRRKGALQGQATVRRRSLEAAEAEAKAIPRKITRWNVPRVAAGGIMAGLGTVAIGTSLRGRENNTVMPKRQTRSGGEIAPAGTRDGRLSEEQARAVRGYAGKFKGVGTDLDQMRMAQERKDRLARQMQG